MYGGGVVVQVASRILGVSWSVTACCLLPLQQRMDRFFFNSSACDGTGTIDDSCAACTAFEECPDGFYFDFDACNGSTAVDDACAACTADGDCPSGCVPACALGSQWQPLCLLPPLDVYID